MDVNSFFFFFLDILYIVNKKGISLNYLHEHFLLTFIYLLYKINIIIKFIKKYISNDDMIYL